MTKKNLKIGLTLSGGGARGFAHIQILKAFDELGIKPAYISGTSMGAVIGSMYASGLSALDIGELFKNLKLKQFLRLFDLSVKGSGLLKGNRIQEIFETALRGKTFSDLEIPLKIVATRYYKRDQLVFESGKVDFAVRASMSIPGIFEPVPYEGDLLLDGGLVNLIPFDILEDDCDHVIAIDVSEEIPGPNKLNMIDFLATSFSIVQGKYAEELLKVNPPDYYMKITLKGLAMMEFNKYDFIMSKTNKYRLEMKRHLKEILDL